MGKSIVVRHQFVMQFASHLDTHTANVGLCIASKQLPVVFFMSGCVWITCIRMDSVLARKYLAKLEQQSAVSDNRQCLIWSSYDNNNGYGAVNVTVNQRWWANRDAHRVAYVLNNMNKNVSLIWCRRPTCPSIVSPEAVCKSRPP